MDDKSVLQFADQTVTFEQFVDMLATKVALRIHQVEKGQLEISQAQAYKLFGRGDVERWVTEVSKHSAKLSSGEIIKNEETQIWHKAISEFLFR